MATPTTINDTIIPGTATTDANGFSTTAVTPVPNASIQPASPITMPTPQTINPVDANAYGLLLGNQADLAKQQADQAQATADSEAKTNTSLSDMLLGKEVFAQQQAQEQNLPALQKQARDLQSTSMLQTANYIQGIRNLDAKNISQGERNTAQIEAQRQNAIDALLTNAQLSFTQGNIQTAQANVKAAVDLKYNAIEQKIANSDKVLARLDTLAGRADSKAIQAAKDRNDQLKAQLETQKENDKAIQNIGLTLRKYGATDSIVGDVLSAKTVNDAILRAGTSLQDPQAKMELESIRLDQVLKKAQINKIAKETTLLGEPTPAERKTTEASIKEAKASIPATEAKIEAVNSLLESPGLANRVGTSIQTRTPQGVLGTIGKAGTVVGIPGLLSDVGSKLSGSGQAFAGGVHKLTAGLSIDNLIAAKARGATFGALSDSELRILSNAASAINDWEIKDSKGVGTGVWNIDEESFKKELKTIQDLSRKALQQSQGSLYTSDEKKILDEMFPQNIAQPSQYFQ